MNVTRIWGLSLTIFLAVVAVVAWLLMQIVQAAKSIDGHALDIWTTGKQIAGNTVSIWMLDKTNRELTQLRSAASSIQQTASSIDNKLGELASSKEED